MACDFYVYQHERADTKAVFYVGKGRRDRYKSKCGRSDTWFSIVNSAGGFSPVKVAECESEELAFLAEIELIDKYSRLGTPLCNRTKGGGGFGFGVVRSQEYREAVSKRQTGKARPELSKALSGLPKSEAHRAAISKAKKGSTASAVARAKMSETRKGRPSPMLGKQHSEETKRKIGEAQKGPKNPWFGKSLPANTRAASVAANTGRVDSEETRRKKSESHKGEKSYCYGKPVSEERKEKQRAALRANPLMTCPHCGVVCCKGNALRWHFDRCKGKK